MWRRYTAEAKAAVIAAEAYAAKKGVDYVSTEHLLMGIVRAPSGRMKAILDALGTSALDIEEDIEKAAEVDAGTDQPLRMTPRAKRVLDLAYSLSREMGHSDLAIEHLFLGIIQEDMGLAGAILKRRGIEFDRARRVVMGLREFDVERAGKQAVPPPAAPVKPPVAKKFAEPGMLLRLALNDPDSEAMIKCLANKVDVQLLLQRAAVSNIKEDGCTLSKVVAKAAELAGGEVVTSAHIAAAVLLLAPEFAASVASLVRAEMFLSS